MNKPIHHPWEVLKSSYIAQEGDWFTVRREHVRMPSGVEIPSWYVFDFPNWVNVIAINKEGKMVMESQYRHGIRQTHYELCAGVIDPTDASPLEAAKRELWEETGYAGGHWQEFMCLSPNPTNHSNYSYTFLAIGVEKQDAGQQEQTEDIAVYLMKPEEVYELLAKGDIIQALHAAPLWKYFAEKR